MNYKIVHFLTNISSHFHCYTNYQSKTFSSRNQEKTKDAALNPLRSRVKRRPVEYPALEILYPARLEWNGAVLFGSPAIRLKSCSAAPDSALIGISLF
ncbi:hypothetical protein TSAR_011074 [Trichomalopsis sarcophagae]|uniref:Uncharacterized protein n=1 Tax=Trichomalopsis sarcophagae TaxID=543379 RepID=A0A232F376_9HYME|nr:hypothetical protein TSAR_011074 [Trichomalopsis sarcophagae]